MYRKRGHFESGNVSSYNPEYLDAIDHPLPITMRRKEPGV